MAEMERVRGGEQIAGVAELARETWRRHYTPIIGAAQVAYMLETFQSAAAVARQISEGYEYYLIVEAGTRAGYFALLPDAAGPRLLLSKIYILAEQQGRGLGKSVVAFAERRCRELGRDVLWLTVNKHNDRTIAFYERVGFVRESAVVTDIGGGFVMDDYVMAKRVGGCDTTADCRPPRPCSCFGCAPASGLCCATSASCIPGRPGNPPRTRPSRRKSKSRARNRRS